MMVPSRNPMPDRVGFLTHTPRLRVPKPPLRPLSFWRLIEQINHITIYKSPQNKPVYNIDNAFTPAFIGFFCKTYGISHYAFDDNHDTACYMNLLLLQ